MKERIELIEVVQRATSLSGLAKYAFWVGLLMIATEVVSQYADMGYAGTFLALLAAYAVYAFARGAMAHYKTLEAEVYLQADMEGDLLQAQALLERMHIALQLRGVQQEQQAQAVNQAQQEAAQLRIALEAEEQHNAYLAGELTRLREQYEEQAQALQDAHAAQEMADALSEDLSASQAEAQQLTQANDHLRAQLEHCTDAGSQLAACQQELDRSRSVNAELMEKVRTLEAEKYSLSQSRNSLLGKLRNKEAAV